jgi:hypothetical protein
MNVKDPGYLAVADPIRLILALPEVRSTKGSRFVKIYNQSSRRQRRSRRRGLGSPARRFSQAPRRFGPRSGLVMVVPIGLALVHQAMALVLFGFAVADWGRTRMEQEA